MVEHRSGGDQGSENRNDETVDKRQEGQVSQHRMFATRQ